MHLGMDKGQNIAFFRCEKGIDKSFGLCGGKIPLFSFWG